MVLGKRTREYSNDSNSGCFEILLRDKPMSPSPHEDDVSGMEAMLRRRKQPKTTPVTLVSSSSNAKMAWTKDDELIILGSIVDYEKETKMSYRSDWDAFYGYVKDFIEVDFSKKQLSDKIRNLNKRFWGNKESSNDGKGPSFTNTEDDEIFKLSVIIWDTNETECASDENMDHAKDGPCLDHEGADENVDQAKVDMPCVEHEPVNENVDQAKDVPSEEHERVNGNIDQANLDVPYVEHERVDEDMHQAKDVPYVEHGHVDKNMDQTKADMPRVEHERVNENMDQANVDVPCVEHERVNENMDQANVDMPYMEHERVDVDENMDQAKDAPCVDYERRNANLDQERAVRCSEDEPVSNVSMETDKGEKEKSEEDVVDEICALKDALTDKEEKEKSEEDVVDEICALKDALEMTTLDKYQQKLLLENLKTIGAPRRKELADEWKALLDEEMKIYAKKLSLTAKIASAGDSC